MENMAEEIDVMQSMLQRAGEEKDFEMTAEETQKFSKAFQEPEFRKMFREYVNELSDPKFREEQNAYLKDLEIRGELPKGKKLIHPRKGLVVKTRRAKSGTKVFVNIVESHDVDPPTATKKDDGNNWELPHMLGPLRLERDKKNDSATTFDCCFHPDAVARAKQQKPYLHMLVQAAFETVERALDSDDKLVREYHVLKGVDYKSGDHVKPLMVTEKAPVTEPVPKEPPVVDTSQSQSSDDDKTVPEEEAKDDGKKAKKKTRRAGKKKKKDSPKNSTPPEEKKEVLDPPPKTKNDGGLAAAMKGKLSKRVEPFGIQAVATKEAKRVEPFGVQAVATKERKRAVVEAPRGGAVPVFHIKERGYIEVSDTQSRPKELVATFELPLCETSKGIDVDFSADGRLLRFTQSNGDVVRYSVDAYLSYAVDDTKATAKFSKQSRTLDVVAPVVATVVATPEPALPNEPAETTDPVQEAPTNEPAQEAPTTEPVQEAPTTEPAQEAPTNEPAQEAPPREEDAPKEISGPEQKKDVVLTTKKEEKEPDAEAPPPLSLQQQGKKKSHSRWLEPVAPEPRKSFATDVELPAAIIEEEPTPPPPPPTKTYLPATTFLGAKPGFVFQKGPMGLGYYVDTHRDPPRIEWRQELESIALIVDVKDATDVAIDHPAPTKVDIRISHNDAVVAAFSAKLAQPLDPDRCRADAADDNVAILLKKQSPAFWQPHSAILFSSGCLPTDISLASSGGVVDHIPSSDTRARTSTTPRSDRRPPPPVATSSSTPTEKIAIAPATFKNKLLFELD